MNAARSFTPDSSRRSAVPISHSLRSAFRTARACLLRRRFSSDRRRPQTAWKYGIMRGARNIGLAARELGVIHLAAPDDLVLQFPGQRGLGIFLHIARQHGIAPPAHRDVERRPRPPRIGEARRQNRRLRRNAPRRGRSRPASPLRGTTVRRDSLRCRLGSPAWVSCVRAAELYSFFVFRYSLPLSLHQKRIPFLRCTRLSEDPLGGASIPFNASSVRPGLW